MKSPLVTIITPSYNQGRFIRATIESVFEQDYPNIEYIVMDGGSTDETAEVVAEYGDRLTWISEKDRGQSHAINKGFRMAKGEIVAWINSDDILLPEAVSRAVAEFEKTPALGAVYGEGYQMNEAGEFTSRFPATVPFDLWKLVHVSDYILQQTVYFRRAVFDEIGFVDEDLNWGLDWDLLIRIGKKFEMRYIPHYMGAIREYGEAKSFSGGHKRFLELVQIVRRHTDWRFPPAMFCYGVDTYENLLRATIDQKAPAGLRQIAQAMALPFIYFGRFVAGQTFAHTQGLYPDGFAASKVRYMVPAGVDRLRLRGQLARPSRWGQSMELRVHGSTVTREIDDRAFELDFELPYNDYEPTMLELRLRRALPLSIHRVAFSSLQIDAVSGRLAD